MHLGTRHHQFIPNEFGDCTSLTCVFDWFQHHSQSMAYRRTSRRTASRSSKRIKYSIENTGVAISVGADKVNGLRQNGQVVVPATTVQGVRKIKHLTISLSGTTDTHEFYWALVYVPEGYQANALFPAFNTGGL